MYGRVCIDSGLDFTTGPHGGSTSACGYVETSGAERCPTELKAIFDGMERPPQLTKRPAPWDSHPSRPNLPSLAPQTRPPSLQAPREVQGGPRDASRCRGRARSPAAATKSSPARRAGELSKYYIHPRPAPSIPVHPCLDTTSHPEEFSSPSSYRGGSRGSREANRCRGDKDKAEARRRQQRRQ